MLSGQWSYHPSYMDYKVKPSGISIFVDKSSLLFKNELNAFIYTSLWKSLPNFNAIYLYWIANLTALFSWVWFLYRLGFCPLFEGIASRFMRIDGAPRYWYIFITVVVYWCLIVVFWVTRSYLWVFVHVAKWEILVLYILHIHCYLLEYCSQKLDGTAWI